MMMVVVMFKKCFQTLFLAEREIYRGGNEKVLTRKKIQWHITETHGHGKGTKEKKL